MAAAKKKAAKRKPVNGNWQKKGGSNVSDNQGRGDRAISHRLGAYIYFLRCAKHLSQEKVAKELGLTQPALSKVERGKRTISVDLVDKVAHLFGLEPSVLVTLCTAELEPEKVLTRAAKVFGAVEQESVSQARS